MILNSKIENITSSKYNKFSVAPMLNLTDRHCRFFMRQFSRYVLLYTEMKTTNNILSNINCLFYNNEEHPIALQIGGYDQDKLSKCAKIANLYKYDEINLNIGCPSISAKYGNFGIYLMNKKEHIVNCINAMKKNTTIPITIKTRIGFNNQDNYNFLYKFTKFISENSDCNKFIFHARKALLNNISPKKNLIIPKLNYEVVHNLKKDFPKIIIIINGGINNIVEIEKHLKKVDGVMIGRAVYHNPNILYEVNKKIFKQKNIFLNQKQIVLNMLPYIEKELNYGTKLNKICRHMLNLFKGNPGAKQWRKELSNNIYKKNANTEILFKALSYI